jgi:NAD(P)-dependent dehydrogenase (short-subunit alcohol dehydrogenase family)
VTSKFLVIGAGGNLGPVWCESLLSKGAMVFGVGLGVKSDLKLSVLSEKFGNQLVLVEQDILQSYSDELTMIRLSEEFEGVIMNVGIDSPPGTGKNSILEYGFDDWNQILTVNVSGLVAFLNWIVPGIKSGGAVVLVGSIYGIVSPDMSFYSHFSEGLGTVKNPAYGASKGALISLCRQYATHLAENKIRVNLLTLGGVLAAQDNEFISKISKRIPMGRMATESDISGPLLFLLSDESKYITGHNLVVDGGFLSL